jgi:ATP-dependent helicase HrpB
VVLDEFHERHLQGDVALAVVRELQQTVRPDLKLVVMSATLETDALAAYLGGCAVLTSEGRAFPVAIEFADAPDDRPLAGRVAGALRRVLATPLPAQQRDDTGDILIFLPGAAEIRRVADAIAPLAASHDLLVLPLHGDLPLDAQQRVLRRGARRKVVLATNVAETSLTIDGVTTVIDSGLARVARYDARHGINALRLAAISRASAEQRAGRAGRTAPGRCLRLWTAGEHAARLEREVPEIRRLELSGTLLELRAWGQGDAQSIDWLDPPGGAAVARAERLLALLGAIDARGALTETGRALLAVPAPPRLARLLLEAERRGCGEQGALLAGLASERDIMLEARAFGDVDAPLRASGPSDLLLRVELFEEASRGGFSDGVCSRLRLDRGAVRAVQRARDQLTRRREIAPRRPSGPPPGTEAGATPRAGTEAGATALLRCILVAFPDRLVRRRVQGSARGVMVGGTGVVLDPRSVVRDAELFVAVEIESGRRGDELRVRTASAIEHGWLAEMFPHALRSIDVLEFDEEQERVVRRTRQLFYDLVLQERTSADVDRAAAGEILADAVRRDPFRAAAVGEPERDFLARLRFLQRWMPELDLPGDPEAFLTDALIALCAGKRSFAELRQADLRAVLQGLLGRRQLQALEREAPSRFTLPSGRSVAITYDAARPPAVAARIQEVFGLRATPRLAAGRVPLVIQLLAPNQRPMQITDDLESFWRTTYPQVRKELRGRYPKHAWPDDPLSAPPTSRVRRG